MRKRRAREKFPLAGLVEESRIILNGSECTVQHVLREGNVCADALAKFAAEQPEDLLVVNDPQQKFEAC